MPNNLNARIRLVNTVAAFIFASLGIAFAQTEKLPLRQVADIPLTGTASRLDYQSFDAASGRLYIVLKIALLSDKQIQER